MLPVRFKQQHFKINNLLQTFANVWCLQVQKEYTTLLNWQCVVTHAELNISLVYSICFNAEKNKKTC